MKHVTSVSGPFLAARDLIRTGLVEVHKMMLQTLYQGSRPSGFIQEYFFMILAPGALLD